MVSNDKEATVRTLVTTSNITDMVFKVMREVAGNNIASTINGSKVSKGVLSGLIQNRIRQNIQ